MSYDFYHNVFVAGLVLFVVMLAVTVTLFFVLNIRTAIADITGSGKRKAIESLQNKSKTPQTDKRLTYKANSVDKADKSPPQESVKTSKISPQDRYDTLEAPETSLLVDSSASETTVLTSNIEKVEMPVQSETDSNDIDFKIECEITYVHSNEVIK